VGLENINTLLFDLDGTLVDSVPDLAASVNIALQRVNQPLCSESEVRKWVGNGVDRLLHRALTRQHDGCAECALHQRAKLEFERWYGAHLADQSQLYENVAEVLSALNRRGFKLGCVTNKPEQFTRPILKKFGIDRFFQSVIGGDSTRARKPDPVPLLTAMQQLGSTPAETLMVGDSVNDFEAGQRANLATVLVSWGYRQGVDLAALKSDALIDQFSSLIELLPGSVDNS
jgi:phosphoglycolate phosphatase